MPILTFPLALALTVCFVAGSLVTWVLGERRRRLEREELERQMTRALQTRYEIYEGLEQTVIKLVTKFDAMESEFKQRLGQGPIARPSGDRSVRVRSSNPELWDIEREHHRVTSEQMAEISRRSARITELMEQVQILEPARSKLESEIANLKHRYDNAVANSAEFEQASNVKVERLEARLSQLESLEPLLEAAQRELGDLRQAREQGLRVAAARAEELQRNSDAMASMQERLAQLEETVARRDAELGEQTLRIFELEGEFSGAKQMLAKQSARCTELEAAAKTAQQECASATAQLESARSSQANLSKELDAAKHELVASLQRCEVYTTDLTKARAALDGTRAQALSAQRTLEQNTTRLSELESELAGARGQVQSMTKELEQARVELALHRAKLAAHSSHVVEAWSVLSELKPMLETLEQKLKESDEPASALPKSQPAAQINPAATNG